MSIWQRIGEVVDGGVGAAGAIFDWASGLFVGDPVIRHQVAFSMAIIALSAKMAKADGIVTAEEVAVFRKLFSMPKGEEQHMARLFDLAKKDVAGFEAYARRVAGIFAEDHDGLTDVVDGLFAIARADGAVHEAEYAFLERVAGIFGIAGIEFDRIAARHVVPKEGDPYLILGVERNSTMAEIKREYRRLVAENHPDRLIARGIPEEFIVIATERLAAINRAFERIERERG